MARKSVGLPGKPPNVESKEKMGIPDEFDFTMAEIGREVPPPYAKLIGEQVIELYRERS